MKPEYKIHHRGFQIIVAEEKMRFTARVSRDGGPIKHDGGSSAVWASSTCGSYDQAVAVAIRAINSGEVE